MKVSLQRMRVRAATIDLQVIQKSNTDAERVSTMIPLAFQDVPFSFVRIIAIDRTGFCIGAHSQLVSFGVAWTAPVFGARNAREFTGVAHLWTNHFQTTLRFASPPKVEQRLLR